MDTRTERGVPDEDAHDHVHRREPDPIPLHHQDEDQTTDGHREPVEMQSFAVEDGDHQDRADVVGDGQSQQEQFQP